MISLLSSSFISLFLQLDVLAKGLEACQLCKQTLHLHNTVEEKRHGLGCDLVMKCTSCALLNDVPLGTRHSKGAWDITTKLASGKYLLSVCVYMNSL
jgi:hypothetical protein